MGTFTDIGNTIGVSVKNLTNLANTLATNVLNLTNIYTSTTNTEMSNVGIFPTTLSDELSSLIGADGINIPVQQNSWHLYRGVSVDYNSDATLDFDRSTYIGSNVVEGGGKITIQQDGIYMLSSSVSRYSTDANVVDFSFRKNAVIMAGTRMYVSGTNGSVYDNQSAIVFEPLLAGDIIDVWGNGYVWGGTEGMALFSGTRIGNI